MIHVRERGRETSEGGREGGEARERVNAQSSTKMILWRKKKKKKKKKNLLGTSEV